MNEYVWKQVDIFAGHQELLLAIADILHTVALGRLSLAIDTRVGNN